MQSSSQ